jgi:hypothetical protein
MWGDDLMASIQILSLNMKVLVYNSYEAINVWKATTIITNLIFKEY